jgi:hypothetical protein
MTKILVTVLSALLIALLYMSTAMAGGPGTTSANFLKVGQGVRPIAMGESYAALGDGLDTLYWNPAGLIQLTAPTASFSHSFWFQDIGTEYLAYGMPAGPLGALGGGITLMHAGTVTETLEDEYGNYAGTGSEVQPISFALVGTYAQKLSRIVPIKDQLLKNMLVGASLRIITESLDDVSVFGGALDLGILWRQTEEIIPTQITTHQGSVKTETGEITMRDHGWRIGFVAQNLGVTTDKLMPMNFRLGGGYIAQDLFTLGGQGTIALDLLIPIDNDIKFSLGTEYAYITTNTKFAARVGYKIGSEIKDLDSLAGLTTGAGFTLKTAGIIEYQLDYAFVPYGELGSTHRIALTVAFVPNSKAVAQTIVQPQSVIATQDTRSISEVPLIPAQQP